MAVFVCVWFSKKPTRPTFETKGIALTGHNSTGPPWRAAPWWVTLHIICAGITDDDDDRRRHTPATVTIKSGPTLCVGGSVIIIRSVFSDYVVFLWRQSWSVQCVAYMRNDKRNKNSSGDEIANVNFLRRYRTYFKILKKNLLRLTN